LLQGTYDIENEDVKSIVGRSRCNIPVADGCGLAVQEPADGGSWGIIIHSGGGFHLFLKNFAITCHKVSSSTGGGVAKTDDFAG
jgi:hypothetical protein